MNIFVISLALSILLCSLVAGLLFTFTVIVMPGLQKLPDKEYLSGFKVMDTIIQDSNPWFVMAWLGSVVFLLATFGMGLWMSSGVPFLLLLLATIVYMTSVQAVTIKINLPINNHLQLQDVDSLADEEAKMLVDKFNTRWIPWTIYRTIGSVVTTLLLLIVLMMV